MQGEGMVSKLKGARGSQIRLPILKGRFGSWSIWLTSAGLLC